MNIKLGNSKETWDGLKSLKDKRTVDALLHEVYLSSIRGGIIEYLEINSVNLCDLTDALVDVSLLLMEYTENDMTTADEEEELTKFANELYISLLDKYFKKGEQRNGESKRRSNTNCRRDTSGNGRRRTKESDDE